MAVSWFLFLGLIWNLCFAEGAPRGALVTSLPGFGNDFVSEQYAGYVSVDDTKRLYYYFVTSENDPASDPLVLWLNGGPGCSSFDGFVYEHGPFLFHPAAPGEKLPTLTRNAYTWAKVANIIYLDSPAGVGFSYSNNSTDYNTGDKQTAKDTHNFLLAWLKEYPEFQSNPFYVSGESWAGVYVPTLAREIAAGNNNGSTTPAINLQGYIIGNGVTDDVADGNAWVPFSYGMGLISRELYSLAVGACNGSFWNGSSTACVQALQEILDVTQDINIYNILEPCYHGTSGSSVPYSKLPESFSDLGKTDRPMPVRKRMFGRAWPLGMSFMKDGPVPTWPELNVAAADSSNVPCTDDSVAVAWLNDAGVRTALHAEPLSAIGKWELCTHKIWYNHDAGSMIPIHDKLLLTGYRALIYSGDHDFCVPYTGSEAWTSGMGYKVIDDWRPWYVAQQVAGFTRSFDHHLTFATVKGAGHTVPEYKPKEALALFQRWLAASSL